jgi:hypothetical protein
MACQQNPFAAIRQLRLGDFLAEVVFAVLGNWPMPRPDSIVA